MIEMLPHFWKGVMWSIQSTKMGYRWCVGNGKRVRFCEDHWFGSCSQAIQYWEVYTTINEHGCTLAEALDDGSNLKFTFRRTVDRIVKDQWLELFQIVDSIRFNDEPDDLV
jgi:hypothetical protein